jgi:hypothetical protein
MISDFFINLAFVIANQMSWLNDTGIIPDWIAIDALTLAKVFAMMGSMSVWFPVPLVLIVIGAVIVSWFAGFGIKALRVLVSHIPFIGGGGN